jgi:predicted DNA-binding transcriptional regulator YafY
MAKYKPQHARLLFIDKHLGSGRYPNCRLLAEEYQVSSKTIQRDLDYMRYQLDAPIAYSARHRGYHYTEPSYKLPAISIKESDLFAIYLAEKLLDQYQGTPIYHNLCSVFRKIEDSLPENTSMDPGEDSSRFTVLPASTTMIDPSIWETVTTALRLSRRLQVRYKTPGNPPQERALDPYHGVRFEGDWYLVAYCHLRQEIRTFSLARMLGVTMLADEFVIPTDFDFRRMTGSHFGVHWSEALYEVKIRFATGVAGYVQERRWHHSQRIEVQEDGSLILSMTVNHLLELKRWVLSWGSAARVLAPERFRADVARSVQEMAELYSS